MTREELLVDLAGRVLALPDDRPRIVAIDGMSCVGKTTLAGELAVIVDGAGGRSSRVAYDDFHQPRERAPPPGPTVRPRATCEDAFDPAALRRLVLEPRRQRCRQVGPRLTTSPATGRSTPSPRRRRAAAGRHRGRLVPAAPELAGLVGPRGAGRRRPGRRPRTRAHARRRPRHARSRCASSTCAATSAAESLHEERHDPWTRADVVVDLTDPQAPHPLG